MDYGGFISETFVRVGAQRVRATNIVEIQGGGNRRPFSVEVTTRSGYVAVSNYATAVQCNDDRDRIRESWLHAIGVDDNGVGLTEESRAWQAQQPS